MAALLVIKLAVLPMLTWQNHMIGELAAKKRKLVKLTSVMADHPRYQIQLSRLGEQLNSATHWFYSNDGSPKLATQKQVEEVFETNQIKIEGFNWVLDRGSPIRSLRASIRYSGDFYHMTKTFWDLASLPKVVRQVAWKQRVVRSRDNSSTIVTGDLTLEFYAWQGPTNMSGSLYSISAVDLGDDE